MEGPARRVSFAASAPSGQTRLSPDETQFRCFPSGQMAFSPDETQFRCFPSGKMAFSPDKTTSRSISSGKNHDPPDGRPMRLARQFHFGKPPLTECALRPPPCQSELAELRRATKACHEVEKHLLIEGAVETLPEGVLAEGVLYFRTPSGRTLTRTL